MFPQEVPFLTTFPVIPGAPGDFNQMETAPSSFIFPQFADGTMGTLGLQSTLILVNSGVDTTVRVELYSTPDGEPMTLTLGELGGGSVFEFEMKAGQSISLPTPGTGDMKVGYARVFAGSGVGGVVGSGMTSEGDGTRPPAMVPPSWMDPGAERGSFTLQ